MNDEHYAISVPAAPPRFRMVALAIACIVLMFVADSTRESNPSSLLAVSLYKLHLASSGAWLGYWIDRATFPYARPHDLLRDALPPLKGLVDSMVEGKLQTDYVTGCHPLPPMQCGPSFDLATLRRAAIMVGCIIAMGVGA